MNLTGVQDIWGDLNLAGSNMNQLSEEEKLQKKKKLMSASTNGSFPDAMAMMFGSRLNSAGTPRA